MNKPDDSPPGAAITAQPPRYGELMAEIEKLRIDLSRAQNPEGPPPRGYLRRQLELSAVECIQSGRGRQAAIRILELLEEVQHHENKRGGPLPRW